MRPRKTPPAPAPVAKLPPGVRRCAACGRLTTASRRPYEAGPCTHDIYPEAAAPHTVTAGGTEAEAKYWPDARVIYREMRTAELEDFRQALEADRAEAARKITRIDQRLAWIAEVLRDRRKDL